MKQIPWSATAALIGIGYFLIAVVASYVVNPEYTLVRSFTAVGNYDLGPHEFLVASTYFGLGLGSLALMIGLYQATPRSALSWVGLPLLGIWGAAMLVAGIFPSAKPGGTVPHMTTVLLAGVFAVTAEGYPETIFGVIHIFASFWAFFSLTLAAVLLAWGSERDERWRPLHRLGLTLALVMLAALCWILAAIFRVIQMQAFVLWVLTIAGLMWLLLMAIRLRLVAAASALN